MSSALSTLLRRLSPVQLGGGLTPNQAAASGVASLAAAALSTTMVLFVIGATAWVWSYKSCRHILDRVSFRILICAMGCELVYAFLYLFMYSDPTIFLRGHSLGPSWCTPGEYFMLASMNTVNFLVTCIALNLFLIIYVGVNPIELRLERWYLIGSGFLGYIFPLVPAALKRLAWDDRLGTCWVPGRGRKQRVRYLLTSVYLAPILSCALSIVFVVIVLVTLFRQGRATTRALFGDGNVQGGLFSRRRSESGINPQSLDSSRSGSGSGSASCTVGGGGGEPSPSQLDESDDQEETYEMGQSWSARQKERSKNLFKGKGWRTAEEICHKKTKSEFHHLSDKFLGIAIRISWYPLTLMFINVTLIVGDLTLSAAGGITRNNGAFWFYTIYVILYGGRGVSIASLALVTDPSLMRGVKAAWAERKALRNQSLPTVAGNLAEFTSPSAVTSRYIATPISTMHNRNSTLIETPGTTSPPPERIRMDSDASFDLFAALAHMPSPSMGSGGLKKEPASPLSPLASEQESEPEWMKVDLNVEQLDFLKEKEAPSLSTTGTRGDHEKASGGLEYKEGKRSSSSSSVCTPTTMDQLPTLSVGVQPRSQLEESHSTSFRPSLLAPPSVAIIAPASPGRQRTDLEPRRGILDQLTHFHHRRPDTSGESGRDAASGQASQSRDSAQVGGREIPRLQLPADNARTSKSRDEALDERKAAKRRQEERIKQIKKRFEVVQTLL